MNCRLGKILIDFVKLCPEATAGVVFNGIAERENSLSLFAALFAPLRIP